MRIKNLNNAAFSLLEVLLASVIFVLSVAGIFVTLNAVRGPVANKENQLAATVFGKQVLEALYSQVENSTFYNTCQVPNGDGTCADFSLSIGKHEISQANLSADASLSWPSGTLGAALGGANNCVSVPTYCVAYNVTCADGSACANPSIAHRVDLNINWPQSS